MMKKDKKASQDQRGLTKKIPDISQVIAKRPKLSLFKKRIAS